MEADTPASPTLQKTRQSTFGRSVNSCCSLSWVPFRGGEGNGVWRQGSNKNGEYEQLETYRAGTEMSLVGWLQPPG